jgi:4-amino-4-deoxy-L-arabinose transferase-like glycosyltransferase
MGDELASPEAAPQLTFNIAQAPSPSPAAPAAEAARARAPAPAPGVIESGDPPAYVPPLPVEPEPLLDPRIKAPPAAAARPPEPPAQPAAPRAPATPTIAELLAARRPHDGDLLPAETEPARAWSAAEISAREAASRPPSTSPAAEPANAPSPRPRPAPARPAGFDDDTQFVAHSGFGDEPPPEIGWHPTLQSTEPDADTVIATAPTLPRARDATPTLRRIGTLVALLLALWLLRLGAAPLFDVDEGAFAEATRELVHGHDWGSTTLNGVDRFDKPILVYWLQAASLVVFGANEFAVRLPSALCAFLWCLAIAAFAWRRYGPAVAIAGAGILATSLGPMLIGRAATADALLNLLLTLAGLDLWRHLENGRAAPRQRAFAWIGLGLLAKGPVALLIPAAAVGLWLAAAHLDRTRLARWTGRGRAAGRSGAASPSQARGAPEAQAQAQAAEGPSSASGTPGAWRQRRLGALVSDWRAWAWMIGLALPWYAYALWRHGWAFVDGFLIHHNLQRFSGSLEGHAGSLGYYVEMLPLLMLPWTPMLVPVAMRARARWGEPLGRYLLLWLGFVLVFFSLSGTKLPHYVLYGFTPLVLLAAQELVTVGTAMRIALCAFIVAVIAAGAASPWIAATAAAHTPDTLYRTLLTSAPGAPWVWVAVPLALVVVGIVAWLPSVRNYLSAADSTLLGALVAAGWLVIAVLPWWGEVLQSPVRALARTVPIAQLNLMDREPLVQWHLHQPSIAFYLGQTVRRDTPPPTGREWAITRLDRLTDDERARYEVVEQRRGYALVRPVTAASSPLAAIGEARASAEAASAAAQAAQAALEEQQRASEMAEAASRAAARAAGRGGRGGR